MRISDWSSDVCSSDLRADAEQVEHPRRHGEIARLAGQAETLVGLHRVKPLILQAVGAQFVDQADPAPFLPEVKQHAPAAHRRLARHCRSEERRVGKGWVSTGRSGWSPSHYKKKK